MTLLVPNCVNLGRIVNRGGALRLALLAALLVPFANLGGLYRVGLPSALACSAGAGPAPGVTSFYAFGARESNEMAVANDGFFAIEVVGRADSAEATLAAINVRVTNSAGDAIDGTLKNFASRPSALFWTANAPLPDATYTAIVSARSNADLVPLELQLHAKGERAPLAPATISPREWLRFRELTGGKRVICASVGHCGMSSMGEIEEATLAVDLDMTLPALNGQVFWEVTVDYVGAADTAHSTPYALLSRSGEVRGGELRFPKGQTQFCLQVTTRDLRDAKDLQSSPVCWHPDTVREIDETDVVGECLEPPSPALTARWCQRHPESKLVECVALRDSGGIGGGGATGGGATGGTGASEPPAPQVSAGGPATTANPMFSDDGTADSASSACSIGHSSRAAAAGTAWLFALAAALGLRRRKARLGRF